MTYRSERFPSVYVLHAACGRPWFFAVDMPGIKRDIGKALRTAMERGDTVKYVTAGQRLDTPWCDCRKQPVSSSQEPAP